jgi:hypothetical protein
VKHFYPIDGGGTRTRPGSTTRSKRGGDGHQLGRWARPSRTTRVSLGSARRVRGSMTSGRDAGARLRAGPWCGRRRVRACRAHVGRPERCAGASLGLDDPEPEECAPESRDAIGELYRTKGSRRRHGSAGRRAGLEFVEKLLTRLNGCLAGRTERERARRVPLRWFRSVAGAERLLGCSARRRRTTASRGRRPPDRCRPR